MNAMPTAPRLAFAAGLLTLVLTLAACGSADQEPQGGAESAAPAPQAGMQDGMGPNLPELQNELRTLQTRLNDLRQRVLTDSTTAAEFQQLEAAITAAVNRLDPGASAARARLAELNGELAAAEAAGDQTKMQELLQEGMNLQTTLRSTQNRALSEPELGAQMQTFQDKVVAEMTKLDPETPAMLARATEITEIFQSASPPGVMGQPGGN